MSERESPRAWAVAVAAGLANGAAFGTLYTFGTFFDSMASEFDAGRGPTAIVFAVTLLLFFGLGAVSGPASDRLGPVRLFAAGSALLVAGLVATANVSQLWLGYLTYGVGVGAGAGLFVTPLYAAVGTWFHTKRAVGLGITSAGNGLGTLLLVPLAARLIDDHGWRDAYLWLAAINGAVLAVAVLVVAAAGSSSVARTGPSGVTRASLAADPLFRLLFVAGLFMFVALFSAFGFVVPFAEDAGISSERAALLVGIIGASSVLARIGIGPLVARFGAVRLYQATLAVQPVAYVLWLVSDGRYALLVAFAVVLGVSYGGYVSLGAEVAAHLFGTAAIGTVLGMLFLSTGLGGLLGPPMAGVLDDAADGTTLPIAAVTVMAVIAVVLTLRVPTGRPAPPEPVEARAGEIS